MLEQLVEQLGSDHQHEATAQEENDEALAIHGAIVPEHGVSGDGAGFACPAAPRISSVHKFGPRRPLLIEFTDEIVTAINNSLADRMVVTVATAGTSGMPDIAFKGSAMAWGKDHIAWWERALGTTFRNLQENGQCCLLYRNTQTRQAWKFFGVGEVLTEGPLRQQVMDRAPEAELNMDPERKGAAVIIRIDRITQGSKVLQER